CIAHSNTAMRERYAHGLTVGGAVQVDIAAKGVDFAQPVDADLAPAQPEDAAQNPIATGKLLMQSRRPDFPGPAPTTQHRAHRQTRTDTRTHLMESARRTTGAISLTCAVTRAGNGKATAQPAFGNAIELLVSKRDIQTIENGHGRLA